MNLPRQDERRLALIDELRAQAAETSLAEFKENYDDPAMIGKLISGISNAARIAGKDSGHVVWGVRDADHAVVGTTFEPATARHQRQPLEFWLNQRLRPGVAFSFQTVEHPHGRVVLLEVPAAPTAAVEFERTAYDRIGSATPRLADNPDRLRALWEELRPYAWETGVARAFASADAVLALLDVESYFKLLRLPTEGSVERALSALEQDRLISPDVGRPVERQQSRRHPARQGSARLRAEPGAQGRQVRGLRRRRPYRHRDPSRGLPARLRQRL